MQLGKDFQNAQAVQLGRTSRSLLSVKLMLIWSGSENLVYHCALVGKRSYIVLILDGDKQTWVQMLKESH